MFSINVMQYTSNFSTDLFSISYFCKLWKDCFTCKKIPQFKTRRTAQTEPVKVKSVSKCWSVCCGDPLGTVESTKHFKMWKFFFFLHHLYQHCKHLESAQSIYWSLKLKASYHLFQLLDNSGLQLGQLSQFRLQLSQFRLTTDLCWCMLRMWLDLFCCLPRKWNHLHASTCCPVCHTSSQMLVFEPCPACRSHTEFIILSNYRSFSFEYYLLAGKPNYLGDRYFYQMCGGNNSHNITAETCPGSLLK